MRDAAEAKAALQGMADAVKAETAAEVAGSTQAAAARGKDITAIQQETQALSQLANAAKQTNTQLLYGGRNDMTQHLSDLAQELNYTTLLNRQKWLGFSSVQQAMSYRQQMYNLALLENKAHFAGYLTADQYLGFLQREIAQTAALSAAIHSRTAAIGEETSALLAHANALHGTSQTAGSLGEQLGAASAYVTALTGIPSTVRTRAVLDDSQALSQLAAYRAALLGLPHAETTDIVSVATRLGGVPLTPPGAAVPVAVQPVVNVTALNRALSQDLAQQRFKAAMGAAANPAEMAAAIAAYQEARRAAQDAVGEAVTEVETLTQDLDVLGGKVTEPRLAIEGGPQALAETAALGAELRALPEKKVLYISAEDGEAVDDFNFLDLMLNRFAREPARLRVDAGEVAQGATEASLLANEMAALESHAARLGVDFSEVEAARLAAEELGAGLRADGDEDVVIHVDGSGAVTSIEHITQAEEEADKGLHDFVQQLAEAARDKYTFDVEFEDQAAMDEIGRYMNALRGVVEEEGKITAGMGGAAGGGGGGGPPHAGFVPDPGDEEAWNALAAAEQGAAAQAVATAARFLELANDAEGTTEAARYMTAAVRAQTLAVAASAAGVADGSTAWGALADAERNIGAQALDSVARFQELAGATELASSAAKLMAIATAAQTVAAKADAAAQLQDALARKSALPNPADAAGWLALSAAEAGAGENAGFFDDVLQGRVIPTLAEAVSNIKNLAGASDSAYQQMAALNAVARLLGVSQDDLNASNDAVLQDMVRLAAEADNLTAAYGAANAAARRFDELLAAGGAGGAGGGGGVPPAGGTAGAPPPDDSAAWAAVAAEVAKVDALYQSAAHDAAAAGAAGAKAGRDAAGGLTSMVLPLTNGAAGWFGLATQVNLFGGLLPGILGHASALHFVLDFIIEGLAVFVPAILTAAAGLTAFGVAGVDAAQAVYTRLMATHTVIDATKQAIPPLTGNLEKLHAVVRPEVWQLYGDAIDLANQKSGLFNQLAIETGHTVDRLAARLTVDLMSGSQGLGTFFAIGAQDLAKLGTFFSNLGQALLSFIRVSQATHIDQIFLDIFVALSQLLVLVTKLPTPLLAAAVGLHAFWLWGGLLSTVVLQLLNPLRSLALALGAVDAAEVSGGLASLGKDASAFERLKAGFNDIAAGLAAIPGRFGLFSSTAKEAAASAGELTVATEDAGAAASTAAADGGGLAAVFARLAGSGGAVTVVAAIAVALAGVYTYLALLPDPTQKWINSLNQALAKTTALTVVSQTIGDLAAVTTELAKAQATGVGNVTELTGAQQGLNTELGNELTHVGQVSKAYGTDFLGALELLNTAGVKTSDIFSAQGKTWEADLQQVKGLVDGYKAMGQGLSALQQDVSVQLVTTSAQVTAMGKLNQAWDTWIGLVAAPINDVLALSGTVTTFSTDAKAAGASMTGLASDVIGSGKAVKNTSVQLQTDFQTTFSSVQQLFDAMRNSEAVTGSGGFTQFVKDAVAALLPLADGNKAAAAEISALAQEAGGPATTSLSDLAKWAGNVKNPMDALYAAAQQATIGTSNLSQDAQRLTSTLQQDLNPAMANAVFNAHGGQAVFNAFADSLAKSGPSSAATVTAAHNVAVELLAVSGNSANAQANFVGFAEAMGLGAKQANALWTQVTQIPDKKTIDLQLSSINVTKSEIAKLEAELPKVTGTKKLQIEADIKQEQLKLYEQNVQLAKDKTGDLNNASLSKLRGELATTAGATANLVKPGETDTILKSFKDGTFYELTFLAWIPQVQRALNIVNHDVGQFFAHDIPVAFGVTSHAFESAWKGMVNWFTQSVPHGLQAAWKPVSSFFDKAFTHDIPAAWNKAWSGTVSPVTHAFDDVKNWVSANFDKWWKTHGTAVEQIWRQIWGQIRADALGAWHFIQSDAVFAWHVVETAAVTAWHAITAIFTSGAVKGFWNFLSSGATGAWQIAVATARASWTEIEALGKAAWDVVAAVAKSVWAVVWQVVVNGAKAAADVLVGVFRVAWSLVQAAAKIVWDTIVVIIDEVLNIITGHWQTAWKDLESYAVQVWNAIRTAAVQVWDAISTAAVQVWNAIWSGIKAAAAQVWGALQTGAEQAWNAIWHALNSTFISPMANFFGSTVPGWWNGLVGAAGRAWGSVWSGFVSSVINPIVTFFTQTLPNAITGGIANALNGLAGPINSALSALKSAFSFIPGLAAGGPVRMAAGSPVRMASGSVPGTGDEDGTHIVAMGGEYMLRKPARMALQAAYGPDFLDWLNHADVWLRAGSRGSAASQRRSPGYAAGGGEVPGLSGVAGMFGGGMAAGGVVPNLFVPGLSANLSRQLSAATAGQLPRTLSQAAGSRVGLQVSNLTINNPVKEKPSESITRASNRLAFLAGREMV